MGIITKIQRFGLEDGPGIRSTVFLKGCPLRCKWCSNPECQNPDPEIVYYETKCIEECDVCVSLCKYEAIVKDKGRIRIKKRNCSYCLDCIHRCPSGALSLIGKNISPNEVVKDVQRDESFYNYSEGGITLSGGEPLLQPEFTLDILKRCKELRVHTVLDTCGYTNADVLSDILEYVDLFLFDLKHMDPNRHKALTGVSNDTILDNAQKISDAGIPIIIRFPLVPEVNDSSDNLHQMMLFMRCLQSALRVEILPYHSLGLSKYKSLGRKPSLPKIPTPRKKDIQRVQRALKDSKLEMVVRGN